MKLYDELMEVYNTSDLYSILRVSRNADSETIKKAYRKLSLVYHPDKCQNSTLKNENTRKFQSLSKAYSILSDSKKRNIFDQTGLVNCDEDSIFEAFDSDFDWKAYWKTIFPSVDENAIMEFESKYKNSDEEKADLVEIYLKYSGNIDMIMEHMLCCTYEDEDRFKEIINHEIKENNLKKFEQFVNEPPSRSKRRKKKFLKEAKEAESARSSRDTSLLSILIHKNQERRIGEADSFFENLLAKYGDLDSDEDEKETIPVFTSLCGKKSVKSKSRQK